MMMGSATNSWASQSFAVSPLANAIDVPDIGAIVQAAGEIIIRVAPTEREQRLLDRALRQKTDLSGRSSAQTMGEWAALAASAVGANLALSVEAGAIAVLAGVGVDLLDDLGDGDLDPGWLDLPRGCILLMATTLVSAIPFRAIADLGISVSLRGRMHACLASGLLEMSGGQLEDLASQRGSIPSPREVEASVIAKSGGEMATSAALGAIAAGATEATAAGFARAGRHYGAALQLAWDVSDLGQIAESRDLAAGARTLPIAYHAAALDEPDGGRFRQLLDRASTEQASRVEVLHSLRRSSALRRTALVAEVQHQSAQRAVAALDLRRSAADAVREYVAGCSIYGSANSISHPTDEERA